MTGERPLLVFAHANGFPGAVYRRFFEALAPAFEPRWIPALGHDPRHPVTDGWPHLVRELIGFTEGVISARACASAAGSAASGAAGRGVVGVGHSLGGYLTCLAAVARPDLYRSVIVLDSPMLGGLRGAAFAAIKRVGLADRITPAGSARRRRSRWGSREEALAHFRGRGAFRGMDPGVLADYVDHGLRRVAAEGPHGDGAALELAFDPQVEASIYRSLPHDMARHLAALRVPAGYLGGRESAEARQVGLALARRHFRFREVAGGHLFPLEQPRAAALAVIEMANALDASTVPRGAYVPAEPYREPS